MITKTFPKRLNIPYAVTIVGDYLWMASYWAFAYYVCVASKDNDDTATASGWDGAVCIGYVIIVNTVREQIYWIFLKPYFSKFKTEYKIMSKPNHLQDVVLTTSWICLIAYVSCHFGVMHCNMPKNWNVQQVLATLSDVSRDYWIVNLIKDNTSMRFVHPWMHKRENYWIHKRHHEGNKNLSILPGPYLFSVLDLALEFGIGPLLGITGKYYLLGMNPRVHLVAFMFSVWTDGNVHSENPYTQAIGNPILDFIFKTNIVHNLHHACRNDPKYMTVFPLHQVSSSAREEDIKLYNKIMETNVDYRLFL